MSSVHHKYPLGQVPGVDSTSLPTGPSKNLVFFSSQLLKVAVLFYLAFLFILVFFEYKTDTYSYKK